MANPTKAQLKTLLNNAVDAVVTTAAPMTDAEINAAIASTIDVYDNLDPDRPVKVRNLQRV